MYNARLHRFAVLLAACTLLLVVAGAFVTSKQAGLSVPDWPLSYGKVMPPMIGGVFYEHGHRMVATTVGFLTVVLAVWLWRAEKRRWVRNLGFAAVGGVILQGVLGGLTVLFLLPKPISIGHACLAQLFFCTVVSLAVVTSASWHREPRRLVDSGWPSLRSISITVPVLIFFQLLLGAAFRHKAAGVVPHIVGAMIVSAAVLILGIFVLVQYPEHPALRRPALALLFITFAQVLLGIAAYMLRVSTADQFVVPWPTVIFTVAHVAVGAATFGASIVLAIQTVRNVQPRFAVQLASSAAIDAASSSESGIAHNGVAASS